MWGKKNDMAFQNGSSTTLIAHGTEIIGDIKFAGELEIQGCVRGNIVASADNASVRVVDGGRVEGKIDAPKVVINGSVIGDIHSASHVELAAKCQIDGDIHYNLIEMVKGAQINGNLVYANAKQKLAAVKTVGAASGINVD